MCGSGLWRHRRGCDGSVDGAAAPQPGRAPTAPACATGVHGGQVTPLGAIRPRVLQGRHVPACPKQTLGDTGCAGARLRPADFCVACGPCSTWVPLTCRVTAAAYTPLCPTGGTQSHSEYQKYIWAKICSFNVRIKASSKHGTARSRGAGRSDPRGQAGWSGGPRRCSRAGCHQSGKVARCSAARVGKWHGAVLPHRAASPPAEPGWCLVVHCGGWAAPETPPKPSLAAGWGGDN